ncbi:enoyl-CoA hydratase/isomerase family protein [Pseudonocardia oroxyli]|uniref:2-ketocyclohexanecarboxyl-CoA hydrolase n=1 Tax=Pseudonocardia oroxyli TaxID=366584 RepID=A0A1G8D7A3_PSEOR|nr:enoyl-CoA hydratase/isomerase family protein [Pseudonocardia oroxyli]SDH53616.1 2-ketocyclohexanecarboxyl-CoA hydrolase [Pseudonocardia oroxyli]
MSRAILSKYEDIRYEQDGALAIITIDRESRGNSFRRQTLDEMYDAITNVGAQRGVKALVVTGAGRRFFSAGGDVVEYAGSNYDTNMNEFRNYQRTIERVALELIHCPVPVIARVNGFVAGGSNVFHLAADISVASRDCFIQQVGTRVGSVSGLGPNQWWPLTIGDKRARELMVAGRRVDAATAYQWGAFNAVVDYADLDDEVLRWAEMITQGFPDAVRYTRVSLNAAKERGIREMTQNREWLQLHFPSIESSEGFRSFAAGRPADTGPSYRGVDTGRVSTAPHGALAKKCQSCGAAGLAVEHSFCGLCGESIADPDAAGPTG